MPVSNAAEALPLFLSDLVAKQLAQIRQDKIQWQNDSHPIFDTLSAAILKLESQTRTLEPVYAGPYA